MPVRERNPCAWSLALATAFVLNASVLAHGAAVAAEPSATKRAHSAKAEPESGKYVTPGPGGIRLLLNLKQDDVSIVTARPLATRPKTSQWKPPMFATEETGTLLTGASEYIATMYDQQGKILESFGLPGRPSRFEDEIVPGSGGQLRSRWLRPPMDIRTLDVPSRPALSFLGIFRATRSSPVSAGRGGISLQRLGIYDLRPPHGSEAGPPAHGFVSPLANLLPDRIDRLPVRHIPHPFCPGPSGTFLGTTQLLDNGDPNQKFDIVILGDGFTAAEMNKFDSYATRYKNALLGLEPFASLSGKINIHAVRTTSTDSGVTNCPGTDQRNTYYHVSGNWVDSLGVTGPSSFFGVEDWCAVYDSVALAAPVETVELIVMIANCDTYGGDADPDNLIAYLPAVSQSLADRFVTYHPKDGPAYQRTVQLTPDEGAFEGLAPHESAHTIAHTVEEYAACIAEDPMRPHPNIERAPDHLSAWWKSLAHPDELDPITNDFIAVNTCNDGLDSTGCHGGGGCCEPIATPPVTTDMLGAWWGAQYGDPGGTSNLDCDPSCDHGASMPVSCDWFRPQATCRMRNLRSDFCRACAKLLSDAISVAAP